MGGIRMVHEPKRLKMFDKSLKVFQVILVIWASSGICVQAQPVATVPWAHIGQGPDRACCSPYAGPLNEPHVTTQLLRFTDEPLTHILLDRNSMLQTVSSDGNLFRFNANLGEDDLVIIVPLPWIPTDMSLGFDGTAYISMTEDGHGRIAAIKDYAVLWEKEFPTQEAIHVLPAPDFTILVLTSEGRLHSLDTDGEEEWTYFVEEVSERCTMPSIGRSGIIYFSIGGVPSRKSAGLEESHLFAISPDGAKLWQRPAPVSNLSYPVIDEKENIYMIGSDGLLYSFCSAGLNWAEPVTGPGLEAHLAYHEDKIIVLSGGNVTAYSTTGQPQPLWSVHLGDHFVSVPAIGSDGMAYMLTKSAFQGSLPTLTAIGPDGNVKWSVSVNCGTQTPPIITIEGNICIGTPQGGPLYLGSGRGDITPPYMAETFPPKDTIIPIDDCDMMMMLIDRGVGIRQSSIYVSVNNEVVHITTEDLNNGYRVLASPHQILTPFQNVTVEVSAEDERFNRKIEPFHLTAVEYRNRPAIVMAGFGYSNVTSSGGGQMQTIALMDPLSEIEEVELYHTQSGFSQCLEDSGEGIDPDLKGQWYSADYLLPAGLTPGRYQLEMVARDTMGRTGLTWPYLTVETEEYPLCVGPFGGMGRGDGKPLDPISISAPSLTLLGPLCPKQSQTRHGTPPIIRAAGYTYTYLNTSGGIVRFEALVGDFDGIDDVERVEIYMGGYPIGLSLNNEGECGDTTPGDEVFTFQISLSDAVFASGAYLYELKAFDRAGNESDLWPYLEIKE